MTEAELLFSELLNCSRTDLYLNKPALLDKDKLSLVSSVLKRRILGEPFQYISGKTEFMGLEFKVTSDTFIPRQETEILVEKAIEFGSGVKRAGSTGGRGQRQEEKLRILDIGVGSGNIAISLAEFLSNCEVIGVDISTGALEAAKYNIKLHNLEKKVKLIHGDLFANHKVSAPNCKQFNEISPRFAAETVNYELIISNPPYIPTAEIENLQPEIKYEPVIALDGGKDGLDFYRRIIAQAPFFLKKDGFLILEMGYDQKEKIENLFQKSKNFEIIEIVKDYSGIDRVIVGQKKN